MTFKKEQAAVLVVTLGITLVTGVMVLKKNQAENERSEVYDRVANYKKQELGQTLDNGATKARSGRGAGHHQ